MSRKGANSYYERCGPKRFRLRTNLRTRIFVTHPSTSLPTLDNGYEKMVKPQPMPLQLTDAASLCSF
jgi:hypothetical protein